MNIPPGWNNEKGKMNTFKLHYSDPFSAWTSRFNYLRLSVPLKEIKITLSCAFCHISCVENVNTIQLFEEEVKQQYCILGNTINRKAGTCFTKDLNCIIWSHGNFWNSDQSLSSERVHSYWDIIKFVFCE